MPPTDQGPIRVLQLGNAVGLYGAERWILALVKHLPRDRVTSLVGVIKDAPGAEAPLVESARQFGLEAHEFVSYGKLSWSAIGPLRRFIVRQRIDILHTHGYKTDILGLIATRGTACRTLSTPHGWSVDAGFRLRIYEALDRLGFRYMDAVAPLSQDLYVELASRRGLVGRVHLIPNGVDLSEAEVTNEIPEPLCSWRKNREFIVGYVGQMIARKRIDTLIRAFHELDIPKKRLCLIGDGPERTELEHLAAQFGETGRIVFLGYRDDRIALMRGFDVFVLPSSLEGIPRCLMEAMAVGIPCVASNIPGCQALIEHGGNGLLFELGNASDLQTQITRLVMEPTERNVLAAAGRDYIYLSRSANQMSAHYADLYGYLASSGANGPGEDPLAGFLDG